MRDLPRRWRIGRGLFTAAVKADKIAIGVDSDQYSW